MDEKRKVIYRYCKVCGRATQRFSVAWTETAESIGERSRGTSASEAAAILAAEAKAVCDNCDKRRG